MEQWGLWEALLGGQVERETNKMAVLGMSIRFLGG
jgi:hypothetical protein